jgi:hypothetical protein
MPSFGPTFTEFFILNVGATNKSFDSILPTLFAERA